jgi:hypothetical protein
LKGGGRVPDDQGVALGPVRAVDRVEPNASIADMDLQPIAIVLQLMRPTGATRRLRHDYGTAGMNESSGALIDLPRELRDNMPPI